MGKKVLILIVVIQQFLLAVLAFGDFGSFIYPGTLGGFTEWVFWFLGYFLALFVGTIGAFAHNLKRQAKVQIAIPLIAVSMYLVCLFI